MGFGTYIQAPLYYSRATFKTLSDVRKLIGEKENIINECEKRLTQLAYMTEPNKFCGDSSPECYINETLSDIFESYQDAIHSLALLYHFENNWEDCHNKDGSPIVPPDRENGDYPQSYIYGDFIE